MRVTAVTAGDYTHKASSSYKFSGPIPQLRNAGYQEQGDEINQIDSGRQNSSRIQRFFQKWGEDWLQRMNRKTLERKAGYYSK